MAPKPSGSKTLGRGETIKIHLKKTALGQGWTHVPPKDQGPDVRKWYETPHHQDDAGAGQAGHSPLISELLAPEENVSDLLDYEDDIQQEDPEIVQVVANISKASDDADIKMEEDNQASGFEPEFGCSGCDVNLVRPSDDTLLGGTSLVTAREDGMLDKETPQAKTPGMGRPGSDENPGCPTSKKE